tara:strand:+ start:84 stop:614 length:531 start_codon:yes stop_codon:yes gene_type:complete
MNNFSKWYLIYTKSREEHKALENLENQGFESFLPLISLMKEDGTRLKTQIMFHRYIFSRFDKDQTNWLKINSTLGVTKIVSFGNHLAEVPDEFIQELKHRCGEEGVLTQTKRNVSYQEGDKILVKKGMLKGKNVTFLSYKGKERIRVLLDIVSQHAVTELSLSDIDKKYILNSLKL